MQPTFKILEDCNNRELVRLNWNSDTIWAIVYKYQGWHSLCLFEGDGIAKFLNAHDDGGPMIGHKIRNKILLSYGTDWDIEINHSESCKMLEQSEVDGIIGQYDAVIYTMEYSAGSPTDSTYFCAKQDGDREYFFNAGDGGPTNGLGPRSAAFKSWRILIGGKPIISRGNWPDIDR